MIDDLIIEYKKFKKIVNAIKRNNIEKISFEFLVGSCFPDALKNIKEEMRRQYTLGYTDGLREREKIKENEKALN